MLTVSPCANPWIGRASPWIGRVYAWAPTYIILTVKAKMDLGNRKDPLRVELMQERNSVAKARRWFSDKTKALVEQMDQIDEGEPSPKSVAGAVLSAAAFCLLLLLW